jgi:hypothetical protein
MSRGNASHTIKMLAHVYGNSAATPLYEFHIAVNKHDTRNLSSVAATPKPQPLFLSIMETCFFAPFSVDPSLRSAVIRFWEYP